MTTKIQIGDGYYDTESAATRAPLLPQWEREPTPTGFDDDQRQQRQRRQKKITGAWRAFVCCVLSMVVCWFTLQRADEKHVEMIRPLYDDHAIANAVFTVFCASAILTVLLFLTCVVLLAEVIFDCNL